MPFDFPFDRVYPEQSRGTQGRAQDRRFEFATATRIIFGAGTLREVGPVAAEMGRRALVVTGRTTARAAARFVGCAGDWLRHLFRSQ